MVIGVFIVGISLAFEGVFLYKQNKNEKENKKAIPFPEKISTIRNLNNYGQEIIKLQQLVMFISKKCCQRY